MQIDPEAQMMSKIMSEDELRKMTQEFDPTFEKPVVFGSKENLQKLQDDLRKLEYRVNTKHFKK